MPDTPDLVQAENRRLISAAIDETTEALSQLVERLFTETSSSLTEKERKNVLRGMRKRLTRLFDPTADEMEVFGDRAFTSTLFMSFMLDELLLELQRFVSNPSRPLVAVDGNEVYMTLALEGINGLTHSIGMLLKPSKLDASVIPGVVDSGVGNIFVVIKFLGTGFNLFPSQAEGDAGEQYSDDDDGMLRAVWGANLAKLLAQVKDLKLSRSVVATPGNVTADPENYPDMCPLEWAFVVEGPVGLPNRRKLYPLEQFRAWANPVIGERSSSTSSQLGVIQSIHLYRETKAPLHHEFALVRLGNEGIPSSWIRVERAARYKTRKIETDSLGPLFGGVTLRENISFATEKTKLIYSEANELAVGRRTPEASELDPFYLTELAALMNSVFVASSKYRLLTYNCRWFARQLTLVTAQRFDSLVSGLSSITWKGESVTYEQLIVAVADDPFGGRPLRDEQSAWIHAMTKYQVAEQLMENGQWREALPRFRETLPLIKARATKDGGLSRSRILGGGLVYESLCLLHLGRRDEALRSLDEALDIFENSIHPPHRQGAYNSLTQATRFAGQLAALGLNKQARRLQLAALDGWPRSPEELSRVETPPHVNRVQMVITFIEALGNAARFAQKDGELVEALSLSEITVRHLAVLHRADDELYRIDLAWHLNLFAEVLKNAGRVGEAFLVSSLCLLLMRQEKGPKFSQSVYAYVLWTHVLICQVMGDGFYCGDGEECEAESTRITRTLYAEKPDLYRFNLGVLLLQRVEWLAKITDRWCDDYTGPSSSLSPAAINTLLSLWMEIRTMIPEALDLWRTIAASHPPAIRHYINLLGMSTAYLVTPPSPELESVKAAAERSGVLYQPMSLSFFYKP